MYDAPASVTTRTGRHPETVIVTVRGPLTQPNIFGFQDKIAFLRTQSVMSALIIDLTDVPYMDSAGIGCLINLYVAAERHAHNFYLAGGNERIAALLETAKVHKLIRNYPTVSDVEATLRATRSDG